LGAGQYLHAIPSCIDYIALRGEFVTGYTPYQPEISQGTLTALFEFQTFIARLFNMDVANASLYDGASALAEALLMAIRITGRKRFIIQESMHPEYNQTLKTYLEHMGVSFDYAPILQNGAVDLEALNCMIESDIKPAAVIVGYPSFFGIVQDLSSIADMTHKIKALLISVTQEPVSLGIFKPPGSFGVDIAVAEGQPLGNAAWFGANSLGLFATKKEFVRQMPGKLVGETTDNKGRRAFTITLATREQHIRREKATSNICTNQTLLAIRATIYLSLLGEAGFRILAKQNFQKAHYLLEGIKAIIPDSRELYSGPFFNEFAVYIPGLNLSKYNYLSKKGIILGLPLSKLGFNNANDTYLLCATELISYKEIDQALEMLAGTLKKC